MNLRYLKDETVQDLFDSIRDNLDKYRYGRFSELENNHDMFYDTDRLNIDENMLRAIDCENNDTSRDPENSVLIFEAMKGLTPYLAKDVRIWAFLNHTHLLNYARKRRSIPEDDDEAIAFIKRRYFSKGNREFERDNFSSRLWYAAYLSNRVNKISIDQATQALLHQLDARGQLIDRSSVAQSENVFSVVMEKMHDSYEGNRVLLDDRELNRSFMKELNLTSGYKLIEAMPKDEVIKIVDECLDTVHPSFSQNNHNDLDQEYKSSDLDLEKTLLKFDMDVIREKYPDTPWRNQLLGPAMLAAFVEFQPFNKEEFVELIPFYLRDSVNIDEAEEFLSRILSIIQFKS